jgi:hypothetical protein
MRFTREFYIPNYEGVVQVLHAEAEIEAYKWESHENGKTKWFVMVFGGKRQKPDAHYRCTSAANRDKVISDAIAAALRVKATKAAHKSKDKMAQSLGHGLEVGDLLTGSWGYEQTNVEMFKVVAVNGANIDIQEVVCDRVATARDQADVTPNPLHESAGPIQTKRPTVSQHGVRVKLHDSCSLSKASWKTTMHETSYA